MKVHKIFYESLLLSYLLRRRAPLLCMVRYITLFYLTLTNELTDHLAWLASCNFYCFRNSSIMVLNLRLQAMFVHILIVAVGRKNRCCCWSLNFYAMCTAVFREWAIHKLHQISWRTSFTHTGNVLQLCQIDVTPRVNKCCENGGILRAHKIYQKCCCTLD